MQPSSFIALSPSSPSFNSYSSGKLAEIAARVTQEFSNDDSNCFSWKTKQHFPPSMQKREDHKKLGADDDDEDDDDDEEEFEFAIVCTEQDASPIPADEIFYNGQIRPIYPLFNTDLLMDGEELSKPASTVSDQSQTAKRNRLPLRKLFSEEQETTSCSSSEADDLENVPAGTYCVWTPKKGKESPGTCKKSSSTGSSKRWKFRDLLYRSNSDGKDNFVFLTPAKKSSERVMEDEACKENKEKDKIKEHYAKGRALKEEDKRRSFLPYRQDLVGFLSNVNGLNRNLRPF
ncbi:hypothetical protein P3X46_023380 [Hevea brasiliensis]|uniref:Uncharacterized protein n=2 Tax=Hevea brasiliensis TaxID=3981 RepID=A0A6A6MQ85_HEVBR|nr:uncharacterized protein LOC110657096 [Hevea brasiliensis]KAF2315926.1 hypothetical protein GH714_040721 [Hevea brasiliensis]KAF2315941.1 hypothetical protein GH714_040736 [Hevea brasiliensis]KAJ9163746.1 hypothetical protein P3X46_023380 [Hevea brasiliensis]